MQLTIIFIVVAVGIYFFILPIARKGKKEVTKKASTTDYDEMVEEYNYEMDENESDNEFINIYNDMLDYNDEISKNERVGEKPPLHNEVIFDTTKYKNSINILGYVIFSYTNYKGIRKKKEVDETELFPIFLKGSKTNAKVGVIPYEGSGLPIGNNGLSIMYGYDKKAFKSSNPKIKKGDIVTINTLFSTNKYIVREVRKITTNIIKNTNFEMNVPNIALVIGNENR